MTKRLRQRIIPAEGKDFIDENSSSQSKLQTKRRSQSYSPKSIKSEGCSLKIKHLLKAKNETQTRYIESLRNSDLTICSGPAGSGKTWLVTYVALEKLINGEIEKLILTRPTIESGAGLGYLPGSLEEKMDPYLRPLYDAMADHIGVAMAKRLIETGKVEIAPLAYMRGRNFRNAFMILDESQNATSEEIKMFLTRAGEGTSMAINGDITQCDLEKPRNADDNWTNGLKYAISKLANKDENIQFIEFTSKDVVRSNLVRKIILLLDS